MSVDTPIPSRVDTPDASPPPSRARRVRQVLTAHPKLTALVAVLLAAAVTGAVVAAVLQPGDDADSAEATTTTSLVAVSTGTVRATVSATGTIAAADITDVSFGSSAEITSVKVAQGDTVTKGQVLGTIDTVTLRSSLADAKATLASARSTLTDAEDDDDTSDAQLAADKASVTSAKQDVATAENALADATLRSPIAGTVASVNVATGDTATGGTSGSSSGSGGTAAGSATTGSSGSSNSSSDSSGDFVIAGLKKWTVSASLDDTEIGLVAKGDQVQITTDSGTATTSNTASNTPSTGTGGTIFGTVTSVSVLSSGSSDSSGSGSSGSSSSSGSATYPVGIAVTGSPSGLHDGASATVSIIYKQATNVLTVPTTAVNRSGTTSFVYVSRNGTKTKQTITTGLASGGTTQVTSGLTTSDKVYVTTIARRSTGTSGSNEGNRTRQGNTNGGGFPGGGTGGFPGGGTGGFPGGGQGGSR